MPAIAFADIGKRAKGLLSGDAATGTVSLAPSLTVAGSTSSGVNLTLKAAQKGEKLDGSLKAAYSSGRVAVDATAPTDGKISINASLSGVGPGVKVTASATLPDPASSAKLTAEYSTDTLAAKAIVSLSATPVVELALGTAVSGILLGGEAGYDSATAALTKYTITAGLHAADYQATASVADQGQTLKLSYVHTLSPAATVGAELSRKIAGADTGSTSFALAYGRALVNGATAKVRLDSTGALQALYMTKLAGGEKLTGSLQLQATDLAKGGLKYGFALEL
ncbi:hypothetical protein HYH03_012178 [Edaphochlamys debaryana]|uniref:Uncharacterized protein n=1 Tax=Edaphochlamys debaryana TaxID=47281 RepID=A0A835XSD7_9CHLO|nr:hypothetical protein HYH03_012178 [Edaphochlamys debaryana]|eukprot:KAG2489348.1 hypothetical protein HYH03_012178 [Edaphochlamys debaryana]